VAATASPAPLRDSQPATSSSLYEAIEALKDRAAATFDEFEANGGFARLIEDLGYLRDRADAIQSAVIGAAQAIENFI
jgi:hypothetical protein